MLFNSRVLLVFLIFLNGYISLSLELVILRQLSFFVGSSAVITSIIMGAFLGFMSLGYFLGASPRIKNDRINTVLCASFCIIAFVAFCAGSFPLVSQYFAWMYRAGLFTGVAQTFMYSFVFLSVGPFLFGFNTTLLSRRLYDYSTNYTGNIMAWDTIGSVTASLITTLFLMPFVGVNYTVVSVVVLALLAALIVRPHVITGLACALIVVPTYMINTNQYQKSKFGILVNNANSTISVEEYPDMKILNMNGLPMSMYLPQTGTAAEYIDYINENFIYNMPRDKKYKILVLGAGGFTLGLRDDYNEYTFVDIERTLQDVSEEHFLGQKLTPNKQFVVQDASQYLKNVDTQYDLILLDVYSNSYQVPEGLITAEFMMRLRARVATGGVILMNMVSSSNFDDAYTRVFDNTFHSVFPYNTSRQVIGTTNPWVPDDSTNIIYIFYNRENDGRIYTINKTPVIYDR